MMGESGGRAWIGHGQTGESFREMENVVLTVAWSERSCITRARNMCQKENSAVWVSQEVGMWCPGALFLFCTRFSGVRGGKLVMKYGGRCRRVNYIFLNIYLNMYLK